MRPSLFIKLIAAVITCSLLVIGFCLWREFRFTSRWRHLKDGMTQSEVRLTLGAPTWTGEGTASGAGNRLVTRWQYERRPWVYSVDFDYVGPGGAPVVFRTEAWRPRSDWWWPGRARAR